MKKSGVLLLVTFLIIFVILIMDFYSTDEDEDIEQQSSQPLVQDLIKQTMAIEPSPMHILKKAHGPPLNVTPLFWFVPVKLTDCRDLFTSVDAAHRRRTVFPEAYHSLKVQFNRYLRAMLNNMRGTVLEGNSGDLQEQSLVYHHLANSSFVKTVCETGFNAGHSAFTWLASNPRLHVYSFDLGVHPYSRPMASFLNDTFQKRLTVFWGDSKVSIPQFTDSHPDQVCDIIVVDGGHSYIDAKYDLWNLRSHAEPERHLVILDDHPTKVLPDVQKAWQEEVKNGNVHEHFGCTFYPEGWRGFTVAKFVNLQSNNVVPK